MTIPWLYYTAPLGDGLLRDISKNENIIVSKPDKENYIVLIRKEDYLSKMNDILMDPTNFSIVNQDSYPMLLKHQDKNNRIVDLLKKHEVINETTCSQLKTARSRPGILYGLPKIHKRGVPMRPILSTLGTHNYNMSSIHKPVNP